MLSQTCKCKLEQFSRSILYMYTFNVYNLAQNSYLLTGNHIKIRTNAMRDAIYNEG